MAARAVAETITAFLQRAEGPVPPSICGSFSCFLRNADQGDHVKNARRRRSRSTETDSAFERPGKNDTQVAGTHVECSFQLEENRPPSLEPRVSAQHVLASVTPN